MYESTGRLGKLFEGAEGFRHPGGGSPYPKCHYLKRLQLQKARAIKLDEAVKLTIVASDYVVYLLSLHSLTPMIISERRQQWKNSSCHRR